LFKNNTDSSNNSYGCHENYCIERIEDLRRLEEVFIPYLITRQIFCGAGKIVSTLKGSHYAMSQRAEHIWESISSATTRSRPIINTRDEPHADPERFRRLHVIVGDSNMSEWATFVKAGTASLLLAMIEDPTSILRDYTLAAPINALRDISNDLWSERTVRLTNGRELTALEIQEDLFERASSFVETREISNDLRLAHQLWGEALEAYRRDPFELADRVDWITKLQMLEHERQRSHLAWSDPKLALIDLLYHDTSTERGLFYRHQRRGHVRRMVSDEAINIATTSAPTTTRARMRGEFIKTAKQWRRDFTVDWVHLKLNDEMQRTVLLKDPFKSSDERFERLLESMARPREPINVAD
jgi:proteasome accessory factor A